MSDADFYDLHFRGDSESNAISGPEISTNLNFILANDRLLDLLLSVGGLAFEMLFIGEYNVLIWIFHILSNIVLPSLFRRHIHNRVLPQINPSESPEIR